MKGNADLDGRTGFFRGAQGPSGAVFGLESTFGVRSNSARSRSRSKEAIQTLHQAALLHGSSRRMPYHRVFQHRG